MVWVVSRFRLKAPPGISSSCITPLTSSGQRSRASRASQTQKSATLSPQPGGKPRKFIRTCGGIGKYIYIYTHTHTHTHTHLAHEVAICHDVHNPSNWGFSHYCTVGLQTRLLSQGCLHKTNCLSLHFLRNATRLNADLLGSGEVYLSAVTLCITGCRQGAVS